MSTAYRFVPWTRRGLSGAIATPDLGAPLPARPFVTAGLTVSDAGSHGVQLALYGPGDVLGIDPRGIIRCEPKAHTTDVEPNYLAFIEFDLPEFPWSFSPAAPTADNRLRPWMVLVVIETSGPDAAALPTTQRERPLPFISLTTQQVATQLPDLAQSWAWAHSQLVVEAGVATDTVAGLSGDGNLSLSRLVCPRRLEPMTSYMACLVPAFDVGVLRGLGGAPAADAVAKPAWDIAHPGALDLPVFYHWEFSTGPLGDFESLARKLKPYKAPPTLGTVPMYVWDALPGLDAATPQPVKDKPVRMDGALRASEGVPAKLDEIDPAFQAAIRTEVNAPADIADHSVPNATRAISAPIYGGMHAKVSRVPLAVPKWLRELNLDPRARAAAGIAADVVRQNQEDFMQACWEQVGDVLRANMLLNLAALAAEALAKLHDRFSRMPAADLLAIVSPAMIRIPYEGLTIAAKVERTSLPDASFSPRFRRLAGTRSPAVRAAATALNIAGSKVGLVEAMAPGLVSVEPNQFVPDGIVGMRGFAALTIPGDAAAMVDLSSIGLAASVPAGRIAALRAIAAPGFSFGQIKVAADLGQSGLLGETQLAAAGALLGQGAGLAVAAQSPGLGSLLQSLSSGAKGAPQAEGFMMEIMADGAPKTSAIAVDAGGRMMIRAGRGGTDRIVGAVGAQLRAGGRDAIIRALSDLPVGMVVGADAPATAIPLQLDRGDGGVLKMEEVSVDRGGRRTVRTRSAAGRTKTVGQLNKDPVALGRVTGLYNGLGTRFGGVVGVVEPKTVAFDLVKASAVAIQRLEPRGNIAKRFSTMITVNGGLIGEIVGEGILATSATKDRIMCAPQIIEPAYKRLAKYDREAFVPGIGAIPQNSMSLLETNSRFIEAYMIGLNHEMNRELLWRSYPTDQRGTVFRHFWDWDDDQPDIGPIHAFTPGNGLGQNTRGGEQGELVLLVRGSLLRRYPNSIIYAWRAMMQNGKRVLMANPQPETDLKLPVFHGQFDPDISMAGFSLTREEIAIDPGWFFVIEQQPTEPRFGFDEEAAGAHAASIGNWLDARWIDTGTAKGASLNLNGPLANVAAGGIQFGRDGAHMAALSLQRPFRVAVHASYLTSV